VHAQYDVICGLSGCTRFLPHCLINDAIKKNIAHKIFALICLRYLSETFLILSKIERDIALNVYWSSCTAPVILVIF
jgi:hypothetical protein